ncbi:MAG TPA: HPr family phosphocarrier protein [Gammaproteobacteria bacterium]|nr:HPr family phosphocarrier protein [Gammaproteobacteria bacterium]
MLNEQVTIQNKLGLHTRAAAKLVGTATRFESKAELNYQDKNANCKSIMSLILLGVTKGNILNLSISGADELEARDAIVNLINNKFGEAD